MSASFSQLSRQEGSVVSRNTRFKGEITGSEDLYLDGAIDGSVHVPGHIVTIGPHGHVKATIQARQVVIQGKVQGRIDAEERVQITATGSMTGDIASPIVAVQEGAWFYGSVDTRSRSDADAGWRSSLAARSADAASAQFAR